MLEIGRKGTVTRMVDDSVSAKTFGSGLVDAFATPAMVALMEQAAWTSVVDALDEGQGTVGSRLDVTHTAATPMGMTVTATSELIEIDGRRLVFRVSATDQHGLIGEGIHERYIIDQARFREKLDAKK
jgi:predicted thioesterase